MDSPEQALSIHGFAKDYPALFLMEGLTQYLSGAAVA